MIASGRYRWTAAMMGLKSPCGSPKNISFGIGPLLLGAGEDWSG
jgi:hypothetical protein